MKRSRIVERVEKQFGMKLEELLPIVTQKYGVVRGAKVLGIAPSTMSYWIMRLGISVLVQRQYQTTPKAEPTQRREVTEVILEDGSS